MFEGRRRRKWKILEIIEIMNKETFSFQDMENLQNIKMLFLIKLCW